MLLLFLLYINIYCSVGSKTIGKNYIVLKYRYFALLPTITPFLPDLKNTWVKFVDLVRPYPMPFPVCL